MKTVSLFILLALGINAKAIEVPRSIPLGTSDFTHRSLGTTCFAMDAAIDGLPCNPAFTAKERKAQLQTHIFFGNNVSYAQDVNDILNNQTNQKNIEHLFNQTRSSEMEASVEAGFLTEKFGISFSPYRLSYYSLIRNSSLPVITLYAGQEQVIRTQLASYVQDDFYFGLQLRAVQRRFILSEFTLTDALVENSQEDIFRVRDQKALYFEPGLLWAPEGQAWSPQVSMTITQIGAVDKKYTELPASPEAHLGTSIKPPFTYGELELGTTFTAQSRYEKWTNLIRLGASYKLGATQYVASATENQYDLAFLLHYKGVRGGLTYDFRKFVNLIGDSDEVRTIYSQIGIEI